MRRLLSNKAFHSGGRISAENGSTKITEQYSAPRVRGCYRQEPATSRTLMRSGSSNRYTNRFLVSSTAVATMLLSIATAFELSRHASGAASLTPEQRSAV